MIGDVAGWGRERETEGRKGRETETEIDRQKDKE